MGQRQSCLGSLEVVVVEIRHRLCTAVNSSLLSIRRQIITDQRPVRGGSEAINPLVEYPVAVGIGRIDVIVGFKIIDNKEVACGKAPNIAYPRTARIGAVDFVNPPVVSRLQLQSAGA